MLKLALIVSLLSCSAYDVSTGAVSGLSKPYEQEHKSQEPVKKEHMNHIYVDLNNGSANEMSLQEILNNAPKKAKTYEKLNETNDVVNNALPLPAIDFMPEAPTDVSRSAINDPGDSIFDTMSLVNVLRDLSQCIELHRVQTLRLCPSKKENRQLEYLGRFANLTDEKLEAALENKCKTVDAILQKSTKVIKDSIKINKPDAVRASNNSFKNYPKDSTALLENNGIPSKTKNSTTITLLPLPSLQDPNIHEDRNHQIEENAGESLANDTKISENTHDHHQPKEESSASLPGKTHSQNPDQNETTTVSVDKMELGKALNKVLDPKTQILGKLESGALIPNNSSSVNGTLLTRRTNKPSSVSHAPEINFTGQHQAIDDGIGAFNDELNDRPYANNNEIPVIKIVTHEYPDGRVISKVNGTEILINNDIPLEENYTNVFVKNINVNKNNISEVLYKFSIPKRVPGLTEVDSSETYNTQSNPDFSFIGRLYLMHNKEKIPAHFVQESDGNISIGLDILSICEAENKDQDSILFKILCKCMKPPNCSSLVNE